MNTFEKVFAGQLVIALILIAGWVNNVIWTFKQTGWDIVLGIAGIICAPVGVVHGIYLWF